jgi:hypothetical protein
MRQRRPGCGPNGAPGDEWPRLHARRPLCLLPRPAGPRIESGPASRWGSQSYPFRAGRFRICRLRAGILPGFPLDDFELVAVGDIGEGNTVADDELPRIWLKAFWGFDPGNEGYLGFTRPGDRNHFIDEARPGDLVLIYGADAPETDTEDRRQALGFLEIDPLPITDSERSSPEGLRRKISSGWKDRWTYAVPVRRAWRVNRRIEVKHLAPTTYRPERARVIATRGELMAPEEIENVVKLPVSPVSVFGESPIEVSSEAEFPLRSVFKPSRGINPTFGTRTSEFEDGDHYLYMLQIEGDIMGLLGRRSATLDGKAVVKVGYSREPNRRAAEHNAALPPAGQLHWKLTMLSKAFPDGRAAKDAEDIMKEEFAKRFESLGGEFFLGLDRDLTSAFVTAAAPAAFRIVATKRR